YHLAQGVDYFLVTDHGSVDRTPAILESYEGRGLAHVVRDDEAGHHQARRATEMARLAHERFGDCWLIHDDADEFWWPAAGSLGDGGEPEEGPRGVAPGASRGYEQREAADEALGKTRFDLEYAESQLWLARQERDRLEADLGTTREARDEADARLATLRRS